MAKFVSRVSALASKILQGDRAALSKAITLAESVKLDHRIEAEALLEYLLQKYKSTHHGKHFSEGKIVIGIAGPPGAGKSTFIDQFGEFLTKQQSPSTNYSLNIDNTNGSGKVSRAGPWSSPVSVSSSKTKTKTNKVAVMAVDPSSTQTGGSILGDKTRMPTLTANPNAFIRPTPTGANKLSLRRTAPAAASGPDCSQSYSQSHNNTTTTTTLGGIHRDSYDAVSLCQCGGFDWVLVETVGVGQSEVGIRNVCDMVLLVLPPGGGDELQGAKKGIVEVADLLLVNKADGALLQPARQALGEYRKALRYRRRRYRVWEEIPAVLYSSLPLPSPKAEQKDQQQHQEAQQIQEIQEAPETSLSVATADDIYRLILTFRHTLHGSGEWAAMRAEQAVGRMVSEAEQQLVSQFRASLASLGSDVTAAGRGGMKGTSNNNSNNSKKDRGEEREDSGASSTNTTTGTSSSSNITSSSSRVDGFDSSLLVQGLVRGDMLPRKAARLLVKSYLSNQTESNHNHNHNHNSCT